MPSECDFSHLSAIWSRGASLSIDIVHHGMTDEYPRIVNIYNSVAYHYLNFPYLQKNNERDYAEVWLYVTLPRVPFSFIKHIHDIRYWLKMTEKLLGHTSHRRAWNNHIPFGFWGFALQSSNPPLARLRVCVL